jgi:hypothetical protein
MIATPSGLPEGNLPALDQERLSGQRLERDAGAGVWDGMSLKAATRLHSPTNGSSASSDSPLLVTSTISFA